jgi:hypothetical protein
MRRLLLPAAAYLLAGCLDGTSPTDTLLVTGATSATSIRAAQSVSINLTIYNRGDDAAILAIDQCFPPFDILNEQGDVVGPGPRVCSLSLTSPILVAAGGSATYTTTWAGESSEVQPADGPVYLDPGKYTIRPRVSLAGEDGGLIYGNPIPITITQ